MFRSYQWILKKRINYLSLSVLYCSFNLFYSKFALKKYNITVLNCGSWEILYCITITIYYELVSKQKSRALKTTIGDKLNLNLICHEICYALFRTYVVYTTKHNPLTLRCFLWHNSSKRKEKNNMKSKYSFIGRG